MIVKELIAALLQQDPEAKVVGYDKVHKDDFWITEVEADSAVYDGFTDGFTKECRLEKFFTNGESVCSKEIAGQKFVVLH